MKKIISSVLLLAALTSTGYGQGFYFRAGLGYAVPQAGETIDGSGQPLNGTLNNTSSAYNLKAASFSAGFGGSLGVGYMFNDHVGVQLDAVSGLSTKQYTFLETDYSYGGVPSDLSIVQQAKSFFVAMPSLVLQTGGDPLNLYTRFGLALPVNTKITQDIFITNQPGTGAITTLDFTSQIKSSFSMGFGAAAGVSYKLNDRVSLWGEVSLLSMSVLIKESQVESIAINGQNQPLSILSGPLTTTYSKNITADSAHSPTYSQPFSNVGFNVGIRFNLSDEGHSNHGRKSNHDEADDNKPFRRR